MSSQAKLTVRPLPHLDFVLGYPGIPASSQASRNAAHISGNIEVRLGSKGMKARWIRVELRKLENAAGGEHWGELIGRGPIDVWAARAGAGRADRSADDEDGSHWEVLQTADFPFKIPIPEGLPSSCRLDKQIGISYEVVASLCVKTPKGLFRKEETTSVIQSMHPVTIEKHEMHSTWPIYNQSELHSGENGLLRAKLRRERSCYAPGDKIKVKVIVSSNRVDPAKIKSVAFTLKETVTFHGGKAGRASMTSNAGQSGKAASQHVEIITQKAKQVGKKLYKGDSMDFDLECVIPKSHNLMTISTAKHIEVSYTMRVYVDISKAAIVIDHIPMIMTTFPRAQSQEIMRKIGFVEGLSDRDLSLDDDEEQPRLHRMHSVNPGPQSTKAYTGGYGGDEQSNGVYRRDTMMSNLSGPGMAGRGVPGQVFNYGSYGAVQRYSDEMAEPPRPAFAGPAGNYDETDHLSATERAALAHYSTASPRPVLPLNADHRAIGTIPGLETPPVSPRAYFDGDDGRGGAPQNRLQHQSPSLLTEAALSYQQQRDAEEEKERLYQRARLQAERNQRRADERRAQVLQNGGSLPPSTNTSRANTPSVLHGRNAAPLRPASAAVMSSAEEEKRRLYERARREAESYQRGYAHGATFPEEEADSNQSHSNMAHTQQSHFSTAPTTASSHTRHSMQPQRRRDSELYWLDSPTVDPLEARGIHSLGTQRHSSPQVAASSSSHRMSASTSMPPKSFPSAEEEKKRLYDQAKAQTDNHLQQQQQSSAVVRAAPTSRPREASVPSGINASAIAPSASSEKAQLARFHAAIDAVEQRRLQDEASNGASIQSGPRASAASPPPHFSNAVGMSSSPSAPALTEKEQMRLYYEAKDRQTDAEAPPPASSSSALRHSTGYTAQMANPRPTYAANYQNGGSSSNNNNNNNNSSHGVSYTQPPNMSSPLPQGAFSSHRTPHNGTKGDGPRVASYTPVPTASNTAPSYNAPPTLPPLEGLSFANGDDPWRDGTPKSEEGSWAPRVASSNWLEANSHAERASASEQDKNTAPPPIPPKTPLLPFWK